MNRPAVAASILLLAALSFFRFPGHTWLQQDTQIYAPMLEHFRDPSVLGKDLLVERPHLSFTLYDETAEAARRLTGLDFRQVLQVEQFLTRAAGIWGLYLMAAALGLSPACALLAAGIFALGATIAGPTVLSLELEPDPRGFAVPLLLLGTGFIARGRYLAAGCAGAAAFLLHPPTVYPFWGVFFCLALWPSDPDVMRRRLYAFVPLLASTVILLVASRYQAGVGETQVFFSLLTPAQEQLQIFRAPYSYVSTWWRQWLPEYLVLMALLLLAYRRVSGKAPLALRFFLLGMPLIGLLSVPVSWLLLEHMKWALLPQFQPMRALLFVTVMAVFLAAVAGVRAAERGGWVEALAWFVLAWLVPATPSLLALPSLRTAAVVLLLAGAAAAAVRLEVRRPRWALAALLATACAAFFLLGPPARNLHSPELEQLSAWARSATPKDAVFLFPDARKAIDPGIFRAEARRAVYVDWKGGGQVNYLKQLGEEWWWRWQHALAHPLRPVQYAPLGIDYLVYRAAHPQRGLQPVYRNAAYLVYRIGK